MHWPLTVERLVWLGRLPHLAPMSRIGEIDTAAIERAIDQRLPFDRARLLTKRGRALERLGRLADARASYRESVELATSLGLSGGVLDEPADALTRIGDA